MVNPSALPLLDINASAATERKPAPRQSAADTQRDQDNAFAKLLDHQQTQRQAQDNRLAAQRQAQVQSSKRQDLQRDQDLSERRDVTRADDRRPATQEARGTDGSQRRERADGDKSTRDTRSQSKDPARKTPEHSEQPAEAAEAAEETEDGKTLPPDQDGLPLFALFNPQMMTQDAATGDTADDLLAGASRGLSALPGAAVTQMQGVGDGEASADGEGEMSLFGMDLKNLGKMDGLGKLNLQGAPGKVGELDAKLQIQNLSSTLAGDDFKATLASTSHSPTQAGAPRTANAQALPNYTTSVPVPFHQEEWGEQMVNKVVWLTSQHLRSAEIHLNPADLGPVEMKIHVHQDQATIQINAHNPQVREALEQQVHRLRDMLANSGLGLAQFDVSGQQAGQQQAHDGQGGSGGMGGSGPWGDAGEDASLVREEAPIQMEGLVNTYV